MTEPPFRLTLRQLPLPAKLVLSVFLLAVGLGYTSALVQLHLQHSGRTGEPLPTMDDVVERFAGVKKAGGAAAGPPQSRIARVITGPKDGGFDKNNMTPAFFEKSKGYQKECDERGRATVDAEREGERKVLLAWLGADAAARRAAHEADKFVPPPDLAAAPLTEEHKDGAAVKIRSLFEARCVRCHKEGEKKPEFDDYAKIEPHATAPTQEVLPGGWVRSGRQMSIEGLTQSTHAHLLSFAVLFTLTGLTFAFTSYPAVVRGVVGPGVLLFQVLDVSCWWLARIDGVGPYFAMAIVGTGGVVGLGLMLQIVLSLFNMYGAKGRVVLVLLFAAAGLGAVVLFTRAVGPALEEERQKALTPAEAKAELKPVEPSKVPPAEDKPAPKDVPKPEPKNPKGEPKTDAKAPPAPPAVEAVAHLERLVMGPVMGATWDGKGSMAAAFFHKDDGEFKKEKDPAKKAKLEAEREGERRAVRAWVRLPDAARKSAYEADRLPLPPDLAGKPLTADYAAGSAAKVKSILTDRCVRCHAKDGDQSDFPLETYEQITKYLK